ncbi:hypothetical protein TREAZ_1418 [Leadbettera azotonutricia ZAS-9]|uniref:Uncharacterized protein n=1 Tax=Leadbettera azotonutricia (strain ATCC BAA-888 / DSM 13862 / ZAS-9) TaxID=545695 RepID=F5YF87_LEAAZ|nr:hypothetical protein TREAZ_1418 [Leadbettera azotonutricia ZAS-9]
MVAANAVDVACLQEPTGNPLPERKFVDQLCKIILKFACQIFLDKSCSIGLLCLLFS